MSIEFHPSKSSVYGTSKDGGGSRDRRRRDEKRGDGVSKSTNNRTATLEGFVSEKKPSYGKKKEEQRYSANSNQEA